MPELPEVETIARRLREGTRDVPALPGAVIRRVRLRWPRHIAQPAPSTFRKKIRGRTILEVSRRGKYLVFPLDEGTLLIHLRMSGDLLMEPRSAPRDRYAHTVFELNNGWDLRFTDARKFGKVHLVGDPEAVLGTLGPEPLAPSFTAKALAERLVGRKRAAKPLLLEQSFLAGIGNIYADEALHLAGIHPLRPVDSLSADEIKALWKGIRRALRDGLRNNGASIDWVYRGGSFQNHFRVYGRPGEPCPKCGAEVQRIVVGQRGTHFCPQCQPEPAS